VPFHPWIGYPSQLMHGTIIRINTLSWVLQATFSMEKWSRNFCYSVWSVKPLKDPTREWTCQKFFREWELVLSSQTCCWWSSKKHITRNTRKTIICSPKYLVDGIRLRQKFFFLFPFFPLILAFFSVFRKKKFTKFPFSVNQKLNSVHPWCRYGG
jgi:hypothetical protein